MRVKFRLLNLPLVVLIYLPISACCDQKAIPKMSRALYSNDPKVKNEAALELARCGKAAGGAVTQLSVLLYDGNVGVQSSAAYALRQIDTKQAREVLKRVQEEREQRRARVDY